MSENSVTKRSTRFIDLAGQTFGRLTVVEFAGRSTSGSRWRCRCECGNETIVDASNLKRHTKSCGCLKLELMVARAITHGHSRTAEYSIWSTMISRCTNPKNKSWPDYGGRGIKVCDRWLSIENFIADMGGRPGPEYQIDRINNDGDYCPENCRWVTRTENLHNTRRNVNVTWNGVEMCIAEVARIVGVSDKILYRRMSRGWSIEKAVNTTVKESRCNMRHCVRVNWRGTEMCLAELARATGVAEHIIKWRIKHGWSLEDTILKPVRAKKSS